MTETLIRQALRDAVNEVLETMFFALTMGESADMETAPADEIGVELTFQGEVPGSLRLRLPAAAARQIAADFLGIDETEVSEVRTSEVVRELANMICGSVLSRVESAATFQLAEPRIVPASGGITASVSNTRYSVQLSNGRLTVDFGTGSPLCQQPAQSAY